MRDLHELERLVDDHLGFGSGIVSTPRLERAVKAVAARHGRQDVQGRIVSGELWQAFADELVVPETWFFRDEQPFFFLASVARQRRQSGSVLRILSAPCSTGEEPYSIVLTLMKAGLGSGEYSIDAIDISERAIRAARRAVFPRTSFRTTKRDEWREYFAESGSGYKLREDVPATVRFRVANLLEDDWLRLQAPYSVIFCRNLLIYLRREARDRFLDTLERLLEPDGLLLAGNAELPLLIERGFQSVEHPRSFACRKRGLAVHPVLPTPTPTPWPLSKLPSAPVPPPDAGKEDLEQARRLANLGRLEDAAGICRRVDAAGTASADVYYLLGLIEHTSNRVFEAERYFRQALSMEPEHYKALVQMSLLYEARGNVDMSVRFRERARGAMRIEENP